MRSGARMSKDHYEKGKELSKTGIYQILAEEAWRDGELSRADSELLEGLRKYLRLKNESAMKILDIAEDKYRNQSLGRLRDFSPRQCYARALRYAYSDDAELSGKERKYLTGLRSALGLGDKDHDEIQRRLEEKGWRPGMAPADEVAAFDAEALAQMRLAAGTSQGGVDASVFAEISTIGSPRPETDAQPRVPLEPPPAPEPAPPPKKKGRRKRKGSAASKPGVAAAAPEVPLAATPEAPPVAPPAEVAPAPPPEPPPPPELPAREAKSPRADREQRVRRKLEERRKRRRESTDAATLHGSPGPGLLERLPPPVRVGILTAAIMGVMLLALSRLRGPGDPVIDDGGEGPPGKPSQYQQLEARFGAANFKVKQLVVRGPDPPDGPPLDLGEAWDLYAGRDGKLYGTAQYRIFQIDPATGAARWIAGNGQLGEPEEGKLAREAEMDPANPRVDASGTVYFRHGSSMVYRIGRDGKLQRVLGTRENRVVWKDGDAAAEAKPGAIEQIALGQGGRLYFDEYSGEVKGPEILGRIEPGDRLRAMFLFALEPVDHPYSRLVKSFIGSGNGFENLEVGEDGSLYFTVGNRLYRWSPGQGPPAMLLPEAPLEFTVDSDGALVVVQENRIERWIDIEKWTRDLKFVERLAGGAEDALSSAEEDGVLPGTAVGYLQPRDLTIGPKGTLYVLDGAAGGLGLSRPRIDMIKRSRPWQHPGAAGGGGSPEPGG